MYLRTYGRTNGHLRPALFFIWSTLSKSRPKKGSHDPGWWMVGRLTSPFSTKIGYIRDKVLRGDLVLPGKGWITIQ